MLLGSNCSKYMQIVKLREFLYVGFSD